MWLLLWALGCPGETEAPLTWFTTCGDPACGGHVDPPAGVPACAGEEVGATCADEGATCDLGDDCNARLICATEDPKSGPGGCPISLRRYKRDVHYLDAAATDALRQQVRDMPLATWRYLDAPAGSPERLGFLIDDRPGSPAVAPTGERVDVYGLASMAVAALQAQERDLEALRARDAALEARLAALEAACPAR